MASILKVDKIRGTGLDSDTMSFDGSGNITIPKNVTFSGTMAGSGMHMIKLSSTSVTSSVASVQFNSSIIDSTKYKTFYCTVHAAMCASNNYDLKLRFSNNNNSSFMTAIASVNYEGVNHSDDNRYNNRGNYMISEDEHTDTSYGTTGYIWIYGADRRTSNNTATNMYAFGEGFAQNYGNTANFYVYQTRCLIGSGSDPLNGIEFSGNSNITGGTFTVYGIIA